MGWKRVLLWMIGMAICCSWNGGMALAEPVTDSALESWQGGSSWAPDQPVTYNSSTLALAEPEQNLWVAQGGEAAPAVDAQAPLHKEVSAEPAAESEGPSGLEITVLNDWVSKYMFRGFDILDDRGAYQPSVDIALWDSGLHFNWWASMATSSRSDDTAVAGVLAPEDLDEFDYTLYYSNSYLDGCIDMSVGGVYYDIIGYTNDDLDFWEAFGKITLAKMPLSPHAYFFYDFPVHDSVGGEGWMTCLGGSHAVELACLPLCGPDPLELNLAADVWYNGGAFVNGVDTGWSHAIFGGSIAFPLPCDLTLTPGVWYQVSMTDTVNPEDEWWTSLSLAYSF